MDEVEPLQLLQDPINTWGPYAWSKQVEQLHVHSCITCSLPLNGLGFWRLKILVVFCSGKGFNDEVTA